jgi:hypothetical protein
MGVRRTGLEPVRVDRAGHLLGDRRGLDLYRGGSFAKSAPIGVPSVPTGMVAEGR